ncbi:S-adenosyl-L-methionine-dependent methyltransferase, partial [Teratosphaeria destructans]
LGATTFASRAAFEAGQGAQPAIPFEQLNLWYNCDNVFLRWRSTMSPEIVTGIIILETTKADASSAQPWLIDTVYSEFNSGAWLVDLGVFTPSNCSTGARRCSGRERFGDGDGGMPNLCSAPLRGTQLPLILLFDRRFWDAWKDVDRLGWALAWMLGGGSSIW